MNCVHYKTVTGRRTTVNSACIQCSDADTWNSMRFVWIVPTNACLVRRVGIVNFGYVWGIESDGRQTHSRTSRCSGNYRPWQWGRVERELWPHRFARPLLRVSLHNTRWAQVERGAMMVCSAKLRCSNFLWEKTATWTRTLADSPRTWCCHFHMRLRE